MTNGNPYYPAAGLHPGLGPFSRFAVTGGRLIVRESNGGIRVLVDSTISFNGLTLIDVSDPDVHWSGTKLLFAGIEHRDSSWRIFEINSDGSGFRKITFTDRSISLAQFGIAAYKFNRYHDIDPCYLPDNRICFASTRYPSLSQIDGYPVTNLYIINADLSDLHRVTTERNGAEEPSVDPVTGRIVYSRWWVNIDMPSLNGITRDSLASISADIGNFWQTGYINPDGDLLQMYSGDPSDRIGHSSYKPYIMSDGKMLGMFIPNLPMTFTSGSTGIRWYNKGSKTHNHVIGVNSGNMQLYISNPPSIGTMMPPYAADPYVLPDGRILFSYAEDVEDLDFGIYTISLDGSNKQLLYDIPGKLDLNAVPLISRSIPPVIPDLFTEFGDDLPPTIDPATYYKNGGFRFDCVNLFTNGPVDDPMPDAPPITKNARMLFYMNFQRADTTGRDSAIFLTSSPVLYNGAVNMDFLPADVPMFEQVTDSSGEVIKISSDKAAHVSGFNFGRTGAGTKCVGCHAGHTTIPVPPNISVGQYSNYSTSAIASQSSFKFINDSLMFPGSKVKDRKAKNLLSTVNWVANGSDNEWVSLKWKVPIDIRKLKLYNIYPNPSAGTNIQVTDCDIKFYLEQQQLLHIPSTGNISVNGTEFNIQGEPKIDEIKITVKSFTGTIFSQQLAGLAEVELDSKISHYEVIGIKPVTNTVRDFRLEQNYPNPFNPVTKIRFTVPVHAIKYNVNLSIFNYLGQLVETLYDSKAGSGGTYEINWNASKYASGIYYSVLSINELDLRQTKKLVLLK